MNDTDLEVQLSAMFDRRAADIEVPTPVQLVPPDKRRGRVNLTPFAVAASVAAVVIAAGGTVVGIRSISHDSRPGAAASHSVAPTPRVSERPSTCEPTQDRTSWQAPINRGTTVPLDHPENRVMSVNSSTGEYLLLQTTPGDANSSAVFGQATLAVFQGATGRDVAALPAGATDVPYADPAGAISAGWIGYGLARPQSANTYYQVKLYNRQTGQTSTIDEIDDAGASAGRVFTAAPVIFGQTLYWIQSVYSDRSKSALKSYDLQTGSRSSTAVPGASSLLDYGIGLATVSGVDSGSTVTARVGTALPSNVLAALQGLSSYAYDAAAPGTSGSGYLHWAKAVGSGSNSVFRYYTSEVGQASTDYLESSKYIFDLSVGTGPFAPTNLVSGDSNGVQIMDTRSLLIHELPAGYELQAMVGDTVIFGTGSSKLGATGLKLVKVSALPAGTTDC